MSNEHDPQHPLIIADIDGWRGWLAANADVSDGIWLMLAKKGVTSPTSISYQGALEEALCHGWIDGQRKSFDAVTFQQRFTPRRAASLWSQRNVEIVGRLVDDGRMRERGHTEIARAKADGRWERAYAGQATAEAPADLVDALTAVPAAETEFARLSRADRFVAMTPILTAPNPATRARRIASLVTRLDRRSTSS